jgi:flagellar protein FlgJ
MGIEGIGLNSIISSLQNSVANTMAQKQINEDEAFEDVLRKACSSGDTQKLKEVCKEFEGLLLQLMYKQMKRTVPDSELFMKSSAREMYEDILDEEIIKRASEKGIGLSDMLYKQLSGRYENKDDC